MPNRPAACRVRVKWNDKPPVSRGLSETFRMDVLTRTERQKLQEDGYLAFERLVEPRRVQAMRERLEALLEVTPQDHAGTLIVGGLLDDPVFDAAWSHPRVLAAVGVVLGNSFRLTGV